jgi:hypothetical protein
MSAQPVRSAGRIRQWLPGNWRWQAAWLEPPKALIEITGKAGQTGDQSCMDFRTTRNKIKTAEQKSYRYIRA